MNKTLYQLIDSVPKYIGNYHRYEKNFLDITNHIYIDDNQTKVYSLELADLIVNVFSSIEGLSKDIYKFFSNEETGVEFFINVENKRKNKFLEKHPNTSDDKIPEVKFDDALKYLNCFWDVSSKKIKISSDLIYLSEESSFITPIHNICYGGRKLNKAYQSIKHDRIANIKNATVNNAIESLGALYILCVYGKYAVKPATDWCMLPETSLVDLYSNFNQSYDSKLFVSEPFNVIIGNLKYLEEISDNQNIEQDKVLKNFFLSKIRESLFLVQDQDLLLDEVFFGYQFDMVNKRDPYQNKSIFNPTRFILGEVHIPVRDSIGFGGYITSWEGENFQYIKANGYDRQVVLNTYCFYDKENNKPKIKCAPLYNWKKLKERLAYQKKEAAAANAENQDLSIKELFGIDTDYAIPNNTLDTNK